MGRLMPVSLDNMTGGNLKTDSRVEPWGFTSDIKGGGAGLLLSAVFKKQILPFIRNDYGCCFSLSQQLVAKKHFCGSVLSPVRGGLHSVALGVLGKNLASTVVLMDLASE